MNHAQMDKVDDVGSGGPGRALAASVRVDVKAKGSAFDPDRVVIGAFDGFRVIRTERVRIRDQGGF
ncbi:MAG: hypothetical protein C4332_06830 [Meiothermus sp.]